MRHDKKEKIDIVLKYLPSIFTSLAEKDTDSLCEIRLRADRPVALVFSGRTDYITKSGRLTGFYSSDLFSFSRTEIEEIFIRLCGYSVHSLTDNIADGFITLDGGIRIGVYGSGP